MVMMVDLFKKSQNFKKSSLFFRNFNILKGRIQLPVYRIEADSFFFCFGIFDPFSIFQ